MAAFIFVAVTVSACSETPLVLERFAHSAVDPSSFYVCRAYGCRERSFVELDDAEWRTVESMFDGADSSVEERAQIASAVAQMEKIVGTKTGTDNDRAGATMRGHGPHQLDCIDETVNTSLYLQLFADKGLMQFHEISTPARRGSFIDGAWPHNTAVIIDRETKMKYAIDSWFGKNGDEADVVPLEIWLSGWSPSQ